MSLRFNSGAVFWLRWLERWSLISHYSFLEVSYQLVPSQTSVRVLFAAVVKLLPAFRTRLELAVRVRTPVKRNVTWRPLFDGPPVELIVLIPVVPVMLKKLPQ